MRTRWAVVLAVAAFGGALWAVPVPLVATAPIVVIVLVLRRPALLGMAVLLLAAGLGARAWEGVQPIAPGRVDGEVTFVTDPIEEDGRVTAIVAVDGKRLEARATGPTVQTLSGALAGERVELAGLVAPRPDDQSWLAHRHVVGRLEVSRSGGPTPGPVWTSWANSFRRTLAAGSASLTADQRALFLGLVLGDDREQRDEVAADFRGAGLTHLLAVSGQNVAFVLALATPMTRRLGIVGRWCLVISLLVGFCLLTRFEPSIIRAATMAAIATSASAMGRTTTGVRNLALAVVVLVLVDPLLVHRLGFRLSVAASMGILVLTPTIATMLPGPQSVRQAAGVTLGAQAGVAPLIIPAFGGMPLAAIPANMLAVPAAGPVMMWGLTGGLAAGLAGGQAAWLLHVPTRLLLDWLLGVAHTAAGWPLGTLSAGTALLVATAAVVLALARNTGGRVTAVIAAVSLVGALCIPALAEDAGPYGVGSGQWVGVRSARASPARSPPIRRDPPGPRDGHPQSNP